MTQCKFLDPVDLRVVSDGSILSFETLRSFTFFHPEREVIVEAGFQSSGVHAPFTKLADIEYCVRAGVLYDWMLRRESISRGDADRLFCDALKSCGVMPGVVHYIWQQLLIGRHVGGEHND